MYIGYSINLQVTKTFISIPPKLFVNKVKILTLIHLFCILILEKIKWYKQFLLPEEKNSSFSKCECESSEEKSDKEKIEYIY